MLAHSIPVHEQRSSCLIDIAALIQILEQNLEKSGVVFAVIVADQPDGRVRKTAGNGMLRTDLPKAIQKKLDQIIFIRENRARALGISDAEKTFAEGKVFSPQLLAVGKGTDSGAGTVVF